MARTVAELPKGSRITDYISLGVLNTMIPRTAVDAALEASSRQSIRQRDLPAHVMVYYVIALGSTCSRRTARSCAACWKVVERPVGTPPGGGQVGYLASPDALGGRTAAGLA